MSLIEKAFQRLDHLKRAAGDPEPEILPGAQPTQAGEEHAPSTVEKAVDRVAMQREADAGQPTPAPAEPEAAAAHETPAPALARRIDVDLARLHAAGMVTPDHPKTRLAEEFRVIKRPLIRNAKGQGVTAVDNGNLIMVTSALPGEGKSFSAINLAISMAMELDFTVLLVDADFSRPSILSKLGLPPEKGLMDVLTGEVPDLGDVILRTNIEKLSILPAGMPHPRATELIASAAMERMLDEIAGRYSDRIIVFDSPPLIPTTEARVLATHMGQVVLVVEAERTTEGAVRSALSTIEACPVKLMMLNKAGERESTGLYGYGYGYGYASNGEGQAHANPV